MAACITVVCLDGVPGHGVCCGIVSCGALLEVFAVAACAKLAGRAFDWDLIPFAVFLIMVFLLAHLAAIVG